MLGYNSDNFTPPFPLLVAETCEIIPSNVSDVARNGCVRIVDMWGGNPNVFRLSNWLRYIGFHVIESITNEQIGPSCGYVACHVAWLLHNSLDWKTQDVSTALDPSIIEQYNAILNQPLTSPTYLTDNQVLEILSHLQFVHTRSSNVNWISGPMPLNYLIQWFRNQFNGTRRQTRSHDFRIFIVNTTPVGNIQVNLTQRIVSGDHWIVVAAYIP